MGALFQEDIELLRSFLTRREEIAEGIETVLNAHRKPAAYLRDHSLLSRDFEECFLARHADRAGQERLRGQLEEAPWAAGFRPRPVQDLYNDLIHPAEMMIRVFYCWQQTRWPGRNGRMHYAQTLFNLYVMRQLQFLSLRLWDEDPNGAGGRLAEIQGLLDELWRSSPAGQPAMVRDARWLIPLAQSLITDELAPYLEVARKVAGTLPEADVVEIQRAHIRMLGGHLTSQIRHYCTRDALPIQARSVVLRTRASNALDFALLVQGLAGLLNAYDDAVRSGNEPGRIQMAGAIWQGISADPELFLNRVDLLSAYSMIEHVFLSTDSEGQVVYSPLGRRHVRLLKEYGERIDRSIHWLREDLPRFRPAKGGSSPYGVIFGLPSHLIEHMALKAMEHDAETRFGLEDVFADGDAGGAKLAWVNGWRNLPHIHPEVRRRYDYPQPFAEEVYHRIERELGRRDSSGARTGRLYLDSQAAEIPELPSRYFVSSDREIVAAGKAESHEQAQLAAGRREAHFLVSYETPGGWTALRKDLLTEVLGMGRDARISGLPREEAEALRLMCADFVAPFRAH